VLCPSQPVGVPVSIFSPVFSRLSVDALGGGHYWWWTLIRGAVYGGTGPSVLGKQECLCYFRTSEFRRQGERSGQWVRAWVAQAVGLSLWQVVQGLGIWYLSVLDGGMKLKV
jgi:hypothetical protein